ncbi:MAG: carboxypeptidase regulatory-like domain-containing protein [Planctomycetes bacterium]|nr:carboxypeptidase regulatory-like domain-containing protein [Planctomycetota bacterium]
MPGPIGIEALSAAHAASRSWTLHVRLRGTDKPVMAYLLDHGRVVPQLQEIAPVARLWPPADAGQTWQASLQISLDLDPHASPPGGDRQYFLGLLPGDGVHAGARVRIGMLADMLDEASLSLPDVELAAGRWLEVRLIGPGDRPIAGVEVVPIFGGNWLTSEGDWRVRGTSDAEGRIRFEEAMHQVWLVSRDPAWRVAAADERFEVPDGIRDVRVEPAQSVAGVVVDARGRNMPGVTVIAMPRDGGRTHGELRAVSDHRGVFSLANDLPEGAVVDLYCALYGREDTRCGTPLLSGVQCKAHDVVLQMDELGEVSLRVVRDEDAAPVERYGLELHGEHGASPGAYAGHHHDGLTVLRVRRDQPTHVVVVPGAKDLKRSGRVLLSPAASDVREIRLRNAIALHVSVVDFAGRPVGEVDLTLREARVDVEDGAPGMRPVVTHIEADRARTDASGRATLWRAQEARQVQLRATLGTEEVANCRIAVAAVADETHVLRLDRVGVGAARIAPWVGEPGTRHAVEYRRMGSRAGPHPKIAVSPSGEVSTCALPAGAYEVWLLSGDELGNAASPREVGQLAAIEILAGQDRFWQWAPPTPLYRTEIVLSGMAGPGVHSPDAVVELTSLDDEGRRGSSFSARVDRTSHRAALHLPRGRYCALYSEFEDAASWRVYLGTRVYDVEAEGRIDVVVHAAAVEIEDTNGPITGGATCQVLERLAPYEDHYPFENDQGVLRSGLLPPGRYLVVLEDGRQGSVEVAWGQVRLAGDVRPLRLRVAFE